MSRLAVLRKIRHGQIAVRTTCLTPKQPTRAQRGQDQAYMTPASRTDYRKHSSFIRTVREWNAVPAKTVSATTLDTFKVIDKFEAKLLPEAPCPVVILLGWAGCQEKHLAKYTPMYEKKGFITLPVLVPAQTLFFQANEVLEVAQGLLELLREKKISDNPIFFHVFSNGGSTVYMHLTSLLNNEASGFQNALRVCGVIFDSAPGKTRIFRTVRGFMEALQMHPVLRYILGFSLLVYLTVTRILLNLLPFGFGSSKGFQVFSSVCEDPTQCPQLFLYSKADRIIMAKDVEEVIAQRKARGVNVKSVCWGDSAHVSHLRTHPEVYTKVCLDFLTACLEKN